MINPSNDFLISKTNTDIVDNAVKELNKKENRKINSRLTNEQISTIIKLELFTTIFKTNLTKDLSNLILDLNISLRGLGRKELTNVIASLNSTPTIDTLDTTTKKGVFR